MKHIKRVLLLCSLLSCIAVHPSIRLPKIIADGMVLQQQARACVWGWGMPGDTVRVHPSWGEELCCKVNKRGEWSIHVNTPQAGGPYTLQLSDNEEVITLTDILIGEVWICSGQSNMAITLLGKPGQPVHGGLEQIMYAEKYQDKIRCLKMDLFASDTLCHDLHAAEWLKPDAKNAGEISAVAYFFARHLTEVLDVPVGIIVNAWGGSKIEAWLDSSTTTRYGIKDTGAPRAEKRCNMIFNSMVYPITNYTARGFIWYQGESNVGQSKRYAQLMPALVAKWRELWQASEMPFYYAQIAPYSYKDSNGTEVPEFVEMQLELHKRIAHSNIVPTTDVGEERCIHPARKDIIGFRFAHLALNETYKHYAPGISSTGPTVEEIYLSDSVIHVHFDQALVSKRVRIDAFEIAGNDGVFRPVTGSLSKNRIEVLLPCAEYSKPKFVRYAYKNYMETDLTNDFGFPAFPFMWEIK